MIEAVADHPCGSGPQGIYQAQVREPGKVAVRRAELEPVLDRQRGQMGIWNEIALHPRQSEQFTKQGGVTI